MDVSKNQQRYKHYTCLCFSVMGQRRFRVSMGVLIASPEAGDASINIIPQMKKHSAISGEPATSFISTTPERNATNQTALMGVSNYNSTNSMNKDTYRHTVLMENNVFDKMCNSTINDSCQFPYYRSNTSDSKCPDAVLVKDVGVSCMLLKQNTFEIQLPQTKTLIKHLKKEYNDLTDIANRITTYTKDILSHLPKKNQRKHQLLKSLAASKHAIASQYVDSKGNLCLKLRLFSNAETQCMTEQVVKDFDNTLCKSKYITKELHSKNCNYYNHFVTNLNKNKSYMHMYVAKTQILDKGHLTLEERNMKSKYEQDTSIQRRNAKTNTRNLTSSSISSINNHLMKRKKKTSKESLTPKLKKCDEVHKHGIVEKFSDDKLYTNQLKLKNYSPVTFTNWKEISKLKQSKNKTLSIFSYESQQMANAKNKIKQGEFINYNTVNNISNTKFHTVNIRIVKKSKKDV
ncbi:uncharacterized protein LOC105666464 isoform X1 [Bombus terrestris]|uniref:Uncharacterized protein LOC105666464 isoform X1 n=2 Tax=Bombus terrestris TaxID=30195 RepID=A0A9B7CYS4_BOMTE|nr:uncharacterized protein LOC105666464 isoform X1 [Bombus terrestris]XP_048263145.1 uncharacterized protein LOC105666464 isoform X1 [Bombus terrestris]XP_048263146.1 uncharacterized protein LOC105666464 isoform X1 [Bombus terrestris]